MSDKYGEHLPLRLLVDTIRFLLSSTVLLPIIFCGLCFFSKGRYYSSCMNLFFNPKKARWGQLDTPSVVFSKLYFERERERKRERKIWLKLFKSFLLTFWIFWHFVIINILMMSAYNRWCQYFFTFNLLKIGRLTMV